MLKNLFIYSFKYAAVVLALVAFSACNRTEFTEEDAYDLENRRAWEQQKRDSIAALNELKNIKDLETFRAALDQLMRDNAGGKVFYAVTVVPGGSSAFTNGRLEDVQGVAGVKVSAAQFGGALVQTVTTDESGIAVFELYSGEVAVHIDAPDHTNVSYVSNLTPNGGVANGSIAYVGNVIPVFDDPNSPNAAIEDIAKISGKAVAELDLTNSLEENVPSGTPITAHIDVDAGGFWDKYIIDNNTVYVDDNGINGGTQTNRSGQIQRIAYEEASQRATVDGSGNYSMLVAATASGLPVKILASDFAFNRVWVDFSIRNEEQTDGLGVATSTRVLYTMNTFNGSQSGGITVGDVDLAELTYLRARFVEREAVVNVSYILGDAVDTVLVDTAGAYICKPTITFAAPDQPGGVQATGEPVMQFIDFNNNNTQDPGEKSYKIKSIKITNRGSGYTTAPTVTVTRQKPGVTGSGRVNASTTAINLIRIIQGGHGFVNPLSLGQNSTSSNTGAWTGYSPVPNIPTYVNGSYNGVPLVVSYVYDLPNSAVVTSPLPAPNTPGAIDVAGHGPDDGNGDANVTESIYYQGVQVSTNISGPGTISNIEVVSSANNWTPALLAQLNAAQFRYQIREAKFESVGNVSLFQINAGGQLEFNILHPAFLGTTDLDGDFAPDPPVYSFISPTSFTVTTNYIGSSNGLNPIQPGNLTDRPVLANNFDPGLGYVFVPTADVTNDDPINQKAQLRATVNKYGQVVGIEITDQGNYISLTNTGNPYPQPAPLNYGISCFVANKPDFSAEFFTGGSSLDYYEIDGTGIGNFCAKNTDLFTENPTPAGLTGGLNGNILTPARNSYVAIFEPGDNPTDFAIGVPFFGEDPPSGNNISQENSNRVTGIEYVYRGVNYKSGVKYKFEIVEIHEYLKQNASLTAKLKPSSLRFTIVDGGLGYAVRPEIYVYGARRSAESLDDFNATLRQKFYNYSSPNSQGTFPTGTFFDVQIPVNVSGTPGPLITKPNFDAEPLVCVVTAKRLENDYNVRLRNRHVVLTGYGSVSGATLGIDTQTLLDFAASLNFNNYILVGNGQGGVGGISTTFGIPNLFRAVRHGGDGLFSGVVGMRDNELLLNSGFPNFQGFLSYEASNVSGTGTLRSFRMSAINALGLGDIGAEIYARIDPYDSRIVRGIEIVNPGSGLFVIQGNHPSMDPDGEPFRFVGGPAGGNFGLFETYSGMNYVRDIHYGTGIELE